MANVAYSEIPTHAVVPMTNANTGYPLVLPNGVKAIRFRCRDGTAIRYAFNTPNKVDGPTDPYITLPTNGEFYQELLYLNGQTTIYFACASAAKVVEVTYWQ